MNEASIEIQQRGIAWHVYHDQQLSYCYDLAERRAYILATKPAEEVEVRLARLTFVRRPLGDAGLMQACEQAWQAYEQAWKQARQEWEQAWQAWRQAWQAWLASIPPGDLDAAHRAECPDCPWDGQTLFPTNGAT